MKVWYSITWDSNLNMGAYLNSFCEIIPDGDWICVRDGDSMFLHHQFGKQIEDVIKKHGHAYDLLGCTTNRLKGLGQRPFPEDFDNVDILHHKGRADTLYHEKYDSVKERKDAVAGVLMLFPKKTWNKVKFEENNIYFDTYFGRELIRQGGRVGLMEGVYVFHAYRLGQPDPTNYKEHLKV